VRGLFADAGAQRFAVNLAIAFAPAALLGLVFGHAIKAHLFAPVPVAVASVAGALVILWAERRQRARPETIRVTTVDAMRWTDALLVGCAQAFALVPGMSRSGATIVGAMLLGLDRPAAAEFSFFLAIPTLGAAFAHDLLEARHSLGAARAEEIAVGLVAAFIASAIVIEPFLAVVRRQGFVPFAWYRIAAGAAIFVALAAHWM
jgi:undecaprenyl-diphosphatase